MNFVIPTDLLQIVKNRLAEGKLHAASTFSGKSWQASCCANNSIEICMLQAIAEPDERYESYCRSSDFIREHVFPGGHLPSMGQHIRDSAGFWKLTMAEACCT